ncbi:MAG: hypothetical protein ACRDS9_17070 [Pseudonocardiaceae bacterium]
MEDRGYHAAVCGTFHRGPDHIRITAEAEGGLYSSAPEGWTEFVIIDGNLYTSQNAASSRALAERLVVDTTRLSGSRG